MGTPAYHNNPVPLVSRDSIERALAEGFRQARETVGPLDKREVQLLNDLQRGRGLSMFVQGCEILRRSTDPHGRVVLSDHLRYCLKYGHPLDLTEREAFEKETEANHQADRSQWCHRWAPSRGSRDGVRDSMYRQIAWSEAVADVMAYESPALVAVLR